MDDTFSYPLDAMITTASNVRNEIDATLPQHNQIIAVMTNLEGLFPGNVEETFVDHIQCWAQNVQACYDALHSLADLLDQGTHLMAETDQDIAQGFTPQ